MRSASVACMGELATGVTRLLCSIRLRQRTERRCGCAERRVCVCEMLRRWLVPAWVCSRLSRSPSASHPSPSRAARAPMSEVVPKMCASTGGRMTRLVSLNSCGGSGASSASRRGLEGAPLYLVRVRARVGLGLRLGLGLELGLGLRLGLGLGFEQAPRCTCPCR